MRRATPHAPAAAAEPTAPGSAERPERLLHSLVYLKVLFRDTGDEALARHGARQYLDGPGAGREGLLRDSTPSERSPRAGPSRPRAPSLRFPVH